MLESQVEQFLTRLVELAVEQQPFQHAELGFLVREPRAQRRDAAAEVEVQRVRNRAGILRSAQRRRLLEIELAIVELADLGQALAQRIQARGVRLQRTELQCQRIDVAARRRLEVVDDLLLGHDVRVQRTHLTQRVVARIGKNQRACEADRSAAGGAGADRGADL